MKTDDLQAEITAIHQQIAQLISGGVELDIVKKLLNLVEKLGSENGELKTEIQKLRDEINRLKGEQGKPDMKANKKADDISSEQERKQAQADANGEARDTDSKKTRQREAKLPTIKIDREQICFLDKTGLPDDLVFKGYQEVVIQDIIIKTDNVKYHREVYYSASERKSYYGALPDEVRGQGRYGPGVRSLIPLLNIECNTSQQRIRGFFQNFGLDVSAAYIAQQWTDGYELFHQEKDDLYRSGLIHSDYIHLDDTSARVDGTNQHCHIVCSPLFTAYFTTPQKDRLTVLGVLNNFAPRYYLYNQQAKTLLDSFKMSDKARTAIDAELPVDKIMDEIEFAARLSGVDWGVKQMGNVIEACAIAYYRQQTEFPVVETLMVDDAPQFKLLVLCLLLCWIHDGRHYKKLRPFVPLHQALLAAFRSRYWAYYTKLLDYQHDPTLEKKALLDNEFDELFTTITGYDELDERIAQTLAKKTELLQVLENPKLPLNNNPAELAARVQARVRDVSYQTRSKAGTKIKDTFLTINQTAKKLGVSFYDYVYDRITGAFSMPSLADLIVQKAQTALA